MRGTNDRVSAAYGLPATGRTSVLPGVSVGRVRDGRIAENRDYWNRAGHLGQLGLVPGVPAAATRG
jgi:ketosteroid isomerase-like protein